MYKTINDIAKIFGFTRQTISKLINNKQLNAIKINRNYRIRIEDFIEFINKSGFLKTQEAIYKNAARP